MNFSRYITHAFTALLLCSLVNPAAADEEQVSVVNPQVLIRTTLGDFTLELDQVNAPITVANFLSYVDKDGYRETIWHRVVEGFMIQGGGHRVNMTEIDSDAEITNEADNGLKNVSGTVAMARQDKIDSASRQFFINTNDNKFLDHTEKSCTREDEATYAEALQRGLYKPKTCKSFGYAVFGKVVAGMEIVRRIEFIPVTKRGGHENVPIDPVIILSVDRI
jgi:cyclophilin family peptidyl-prolyl cis-trans isomerase